MAVLVEYSEFVEIIIPRCKVGLVIGKRGETIKELLKKCGVKMVVTIQEVPRWIVKQ